MFVSQLLRTSIFYSCDSHELSSLSPLVPWQMCFMTWKSKLKLLAHVRDTLHKSDWSWPGGTEGEGCCASGTVFALGTMLFRLCTSFVKNYFSASQVLRNGKRLDIRSVRSLVFVNSCYFFSCSQVYLKGRARCFISIIFLKSQPWFVSKLLERDEKAWTECCQANF